MTQDWRIPINFADSFHQQQKRMMRQERRPTVTDATQLLGPGAGPFAVQVEDWNDEAATFVGVFYSEPGAFNQPTGMDHYWIGETFGYVNLDGERWGFQRITRIRHPSDAAGVDPVGWNVQVRRFFAQGDLVAYTDWMPA